MIYLQAPFNAPAYQVILKNPEVQDNIILNVKSMYYRSMAGNLVGLKKTPAYKNHKLTFIGLTRRKALEVLAFVKSAAGLEMKYIDKDGTIWKGVLVSVPFEIEVTGPGRSAFPAERKEANTIVLEFQGVQT